MIEDKMRNCDLCGNAGIKEKCNACGRNRQYGDMFVLDSKVKAYMELEKEECVNGNPK